MVRWIRRRWTQARSEKDDAQRGWVGADGGAAPRSSETRSTREERSFYRRQADPFGSFGSRGAAAAVRQAMLSTLSRDGPRMIREMPHTWPVTREHLRLLAIELEREDLIELEPAERGGVRFRSADRSRAPQRPEDWLSGRRARLRMTK